MRPVNILVYLLRVGLDLERRLFDTVHFPQHVVVGYGEYTMFKRLHTTIVPLLLLIAGSVNPLQAASEPKEVTIAGSTISSLQSAGYRVDWINQVPTNELRLPTILQDSFYTLNDDDYLSRYDSVTGKWLWSTPIGNNVFDMLSISSFPRLDKVYVLSDGLLYSTNNLTGTATSNGIEKPHVHLRWVPNTPAIVSDNLLVYGSTKGDLVWLNPSTGAVSARYQIGDSISSVPVSISALRHPDGRMLELIIGASKNGTLVAIDKGSRTQAWRMQLTAPVVAPISSATNTELIGEETIPRSSVFIAGQDQYLRAVDTHTGKPRWRVLTTAPLEDAPAVYGDVLYQQIPGEGLACFTTFPQDFSGNRKWTAALVNGAVFTTNAKGRLVTWDAPAKVLQILDPFNGTVIRTIALPEAKNVLTDSVQNGSIFILTENDEIIRLAPR